MADQDYPSLFAAQEAAAVKAAAAATAFLLMLGGTEDQTVALPGYPDQPTLAKRIADWIGQQAMKFAALAPESGYAFAITDTTGRAAILIGLDGSVTIPKFAASVGSIDGRSLVLETVMKDALEPSLAEMIADELPTDSGYVWVVVDDEGRVGLGITVDGFVEGKFRMLPKSVSRAMLDDALSALVPVSLSPETGYVWALVDVNGKIALGINAAGKVIGNIDVPAPPDPAGIKYLVPTVDLLCAGDSLTASSSQITWREQLAPLVSARTIVNGGIGGQTGPQVAARFGAGHSLMTLTGNQIPASGAVTLTALDVRLLSTPAQSSGTTTIKGSLGGILGTVACTHDATDDLLDVYTFTRDVAGDAVYLAPKSPFEPVVAGDGFYTEIIWIGRNDINYLLSVEDVKTSIEKMVGVQKTAEKRFLIITPPMGGPQTAGQSTGEGFGTTRMNMCLAIEDWATAKYGDRVIKIREWLQQFNNGSADDLDDVAKGVVPRSLRIDTQHNSTISNGHIARRIAYELNRRSW